MGSGEKPLSSKPGQLHRRQAALARAVLGGVQGQGETVRGCALQRGGAGSPAEKKQVVRAWVGEMKLAPERLAVEWTCRIPEPVMHSVVAGAGLGADSERVPLVIVRWAYEGVRQGERQMRRVGLAG